MTTVRADVVALIIDVEDMFAYPNLRRISTGQPLTPEEVALAGSATRVEMKAKLDYLALVLAQAEADLRDEQRIGELVEPYFARLGPDATLGDVEKLMTPEELAEYMEIMDRQAPDGYLFIPGGTA